MALDINSILKMAAGKVLETHDEYQGKFSPDDITGSVVSSSVPLNLILAEAAVIAARDLQGKSTRAHRDSVEFLVARRTPKELAFTEKSSVLWSLDPEVVKKCVVTANAAIELIHDLSLMYGIELFEILGMRNLSSFVGEVFCKEIREMYSDKLIGNPNQDGYPDLCALTPEGKRYIKEKLRNTDDSLKTDKSLWSPYPFGGVEVKATCGNTPASSIMPKPKLGEPRLPILVSAEWKAHHQLTKQLLGILWDFIDGLPTVLAAFYRNDLDTKEGSKNKDWGAIIHPREGGGRTTSVSIMKKGRSKDEGVKKMGAGYLVLPKNKELLEPICRVFDIQI